VTSLDSSCTDFPFHVFLSLTTIFVDKSYLHVGFSKRLQVASVVASSVNLTVHKSNYAFQKKVGTLILLKCPFKRVKWESKLSTNQQFFLEILTKAICSISIIFLLRHRSVNASCDSKASVTIEVVARREVRLG
jgi:hypothetical protein